MSSFPVTLRTLIVNGTSKTTMLDAIKNCSEQKDKWFECANADGGMEIVDGSLSMHPSESMIQLADGAIQCSYTLVLVWQVPKEGV